MQIFARSTRAIQRATQHCSAKASPPVELRVSLAWPTAEVPSYNCGRLGTPSSGASAVAGSDRLLFFSSPELFSRGDEHAERWAHRAANARPASYAHKANCSSRSRHGRKRSLIQNPSAAAPAETNKLKTRTSRKESRKHPTFLPYRPRSKKRTPTQMSALICASPVMSAYRLSVSVRAGRTGFFIQLRHRLRYRASRGELVCDTAALPPPGLAGGSRGQWRRSSGRRSTRNRQQE